MMLGVTAESGWAKVTVRITPELHRRLRLVVVVQDTSVQALVESWIVRYVEHHEQKEALRRERARP